MSENTPHPLPSDGEAIRCAPWRLVPASSYRHPMLVVASRWQRRALRPRDRGPDHRPGTVIVARRCRVAANRSLADSGHQRRTNWGSRGQSPPSAFAGDARSVATGSMLAYDK